MANTPWNNFAISEIFADSELLQFCFSDFAKTSLSAYNTLSGTISLMEKCSLMVKYLVNFDYFLSFACIFLCDCSRPFMRRLKLFVFDNIPHSCEQMVAQTKLLHEDIRIDRDISTVSSPCNSSSGKDMMVIITSVLQQQQVLPQHLQVLIPSQSREMIDPRLWFMRGGGKVK